MMDAPQFVKLNAVTLAEEEQSCLQIHAQHYAATEWLLVLSNAMIIIRMMKMDAAQRALSRPDSYASMKRASHQTVYG
jgi:hypothetical protein